MNRGGTMFCGKCGKEIQDDFTFCPYCGAKLCHVRSESAGERPAVKATRTAVDVQKVSDSRKARAIVTLILFIIGTAFLLASKSI
ncbi:zinc-ribbon domain-containing protein [Megasphaera sp.]|uniref:zinc-ribbon domain-containing protein n=1 Tax=Megasphaera sp. TaxID=2023260 RepID=UPI004029D1F4